jgi:hypothetical protein
MNNIPQGKANKPKSKGTSVVILVLVVLLLCIFSICIISSISNMFNGENKPSEVKLTENNLNDSTPSISPTLESTQTPTILATVVPFIVVNETANLREGPGLSFNITRILNKGETYQVFMRSSDNSWLSLDQGNKNWISTSLVSLSGDINSLPVGTIQEIIQSDSTNSSQPNSPKYLPLLGKLYTGVKVYYGKLKAYGFEILGGSESCPTMPSGRGVYVLYPNGSEEWKDRLYLIGSDIFFVVEGDPAYTKMEWYEYPGCP